ncbi:hypothetical protein O1611_g5908 [Lasiodiplodia mahajangana]|uniref:Uncharacterized protein n=1 Tax=Lasiodiplodia mahajangana TaxID=1108764 RepID=A0ACC2JJM8_9PEZI|nr:hypothetical protein O1611_g5908 [Lasiodiplodia mahajangana]
MMSKEDSNEKLEIVAPEFVQYEYGSPEEIEERRRKENALVRRLDCFIMPVLMLLNLISYLDRGNIGFAATQGMAQEIHLQVASALAGAFGGLIAWAVIHLDGVSNMSGWRWLYIIEGLITVVWAGLCVFLVPQNYETAYFLNDEQKSLMRKRAEETDAYSGGSGHYTKKDIKEAAKDVKSWTHGIIQIAVVTVLYGFSTFLPIIIKDGFHFSTVQAQYLVIPVNIWASIVYTIGAFISDRYTTRFLPLVICAPFGIAGYAILLCNVPPGIRYFATYLIAIPCFLCTGGNITWLSSNCAPDGKRAASLGILLTLTNIGGVIAGQIYQSNAGPNFTLGHAWSLGSLSIAWLGWWIVRMIYTRRQAIKDKMLVEGIVVPEGEYTDRAPDFKYQI